MKKTLLTILALILTVTLGAQIAKAIGSLTPSGTAGDDTQYSLNDIYDKLANFSDTPTATSSPFTTPGSVAASFRTLTEVYNLLTAENSDLVAGNIATGTNIFGVMGTMQGLPAPLTWQTDPGLSLCWGNGQFEIDNGCSIGNGWTAEGYGAVQYCENLVDEGSSDWRLPTIAEYQSITDFTTYNNATQVPGFAQNVSYWSSTPYAGGPNYAWFWYTYVGDVSYNDKNGQYQVRCVH